jgi:hypothetical protein
MTTKNITSEWEKPHELDAKSALRDAPCSPSWFVNGAEYRERDGWIEARNHLNPEWVIVDKAKQD